MCHQPVKPTSSPQGLATQAQAQERAAPDGEAENRAPGFVREEQAGSAQTLQGDSVPAEDGERGEDPQVSGDAGAPPDLARPSVQGLRFNASGHFVGLATPEGPWSGPDPWAWAQEEERLEGRNGAGLHGQPDNGAEAEAVCGGPGQSGSRLPPLAAGSSSEGSRAWEPQDGLWGRGLDDVLLGKSHTSTRAHEAGTTGTEDTGGGPQETSLDRRPRRRTPVCSAVEGYEGDGLADVGQELPPAGSRGIHRNGSAPDAGFSADGPGQDPGLN